MFYLSEKKPLPPRVILVQALLRLKGFDLRITGKWDKKTAEAIGKFRTKIGMDSQGPVDGQVFYNLIRETKLKLIKSVDASGGDMAACVEADSKKAGISPLMNPRVQGKGVQKAVDLITERAKGYHIALLSMHGHGNEGAWISVALGDPYHARKAGKMAEYKEMKDDWRSYIDYSHFERHRANLSRLQNLFAPFGCVEVNSCTIATKSPGLLQKLANTWGVPVSGGKGVQRNGTWDFNNNCVYQNEVGEQVNATFEMEGDVLTAYPNHTTMAKWAEQVEGALILSELGREMQRSISSFAGK
jgi:hypothetical protein